MSRYLLFLICCQLLSPVPGSSLETPPIYGSNMVLQQNMQVPIRGSADPGQTVEISFADQTVSGKANDKGEWVLSLKAMKASAEGRTLRVTSGDKERVWENILVGEVWLGSGQSNMAGKAGGYAKKDPTLAAVVAKEIPNLRLFGNGKWQSAGPETSKAHSALLLAFGERIHRDLEVPVGLYFGAVGGTPSGAWIPKETFDDSTAIKAVVDNFRSGYDPEKAMKLYQTKLARFEKIAAEAKAKGDKVKGRKPQPPVAPGESSRGQIGGLFDRYIRPHAGFAMRGVLWDQGEAGTAVVGLDQHTCMSELIRGWRGLWNQGDFPFIFIQKPSGMGNSFSKENPITRESDPFTPLPDIKKVDNGGSGRFLYTRLMLDNDHTWMVPCCDLGATIHPINKWGYGNRAAEVAAQKVYQTDTQAYGPLYASHQVSGDTVTIRFTETGEGLTVAHSDTLQGFALAGEDNQWHWAQAKITAPDTVTLSAGGVTNPTAVRYAYAKNRQWANLFNKNGLPAIAFTAGE